MFPVLMALPRTAGLVAHWLESLDDPEYKIYRPRQVYKGVTRRGYEDLEGDEGDENKEETREENLHQKEPVVVEISQQQQQQQQSSSSMQSSLNASSQLRQPVLASSYVGSNPMAARRRSAAEMTLAEVNELIRQTQQAIQEWTVSEKEKENVTEETNANPEQQQQQERSMEHQTSSSSIANPTPPTSSSNLFGALPPSSLHPSLPSFRSLASQLSHNLGHTAAGSNNGNSVGLMGLTGLTGRLSGLSSNVVTAASASAVTASRRISRSFGFGSGIESTESSKSEVCGKCDLSIMMIFI